MLKRGVLFKREIFSKSHFEWIRPSKFILNNNKSEN